MAATAEPPVVRATPKKKPKPSRSTGRKLFNHDRKLGHRFVAGADEAGRGCLAGPKLKYGTTWKRSGFTCTIRESGVRCANGRGHGFELRLGRQRLF